MSLFLRTVLNVVTCHDKAKMELEVVKSKFHSIIIILRRFLNFCQRQYSTYCNWKSTVPSHHTVSTQNGRNNNMPFLQIYFKKRIIYDPSNLNLAINKLISLKQTKEPLQPRQKQLLYIIIVAATF